MTRPDRARRQPIVQFLLDTSFCLYLIKARPRHLLSVFAEYQPGEISVSAITVAALRTMAERSRDPEGNGRALDRFFLPLVVADFDGEAARLLGQVTGWWGYGAAGQAVHSQLLAAHALHLNATLVTADPELYAPVPGLRVNGPSAAPLLEEQKPADEYCNWRQPASPRPLDGVSGAIVVVGSHDIMLDLLGDYLHAQHPDVTLISAHVGSLGGLLALQRNEAHLAGSHLLDEETGDYNKGHIQRMLTPYGRRVVLLGFVSRVQGLILAKDNPKGIRTLDDLLRPDVRFVNRQEGAGTRVLLDFELRQGELAKDQISGYENEESSHAAVSAAVAGGTADCGLGIEAAAHAQNLDFVPLFDERYDLVVPVDHFESERLAPLLALLRHPTADFLGRVAALGGYETTMMGRVLAEL